MLPFVFVSRFDDFECFDSLLLRLPFGSSARSSSQMMCVTTLLPMLRTLHRSAETFSQLFRVAENSTLNIESLQLSEQSFEERLLHVCRSRYFGRRGCSDDRMFRTRRYNV